MILVTTRWILCFVLSMSSVTASAETVALWLFDDPLGSSVAVDSSGNGYHLTLGADAAVVADGKFGGALDDDATEADGLGAYRYKAEKALNPGDQDWTLECWVKAKPEMTGDNQLWGLSGVNYIDFGRGDNRGLYVASRFLPLDGVTAWNKPTGNLTADDQFHHVAVVYSSQSHELRHFFDGQLKFTAQGVWKDVYTGDPPHDKVVFPPHYPMLQVGMRDAYQQWDHREIHQHDRLMKKFQGTIDEMRFSDKSLYQDSFVPPESFSKPALRVWPERLSVVVAKGTNSLLEQTLMISSNDPITNWRVQEQIPWLTMVPSKGNMTSGPVEAKVQVDTKKLKPGRHEGTLEFVTGELGKVVVPVLLSVIEPDQIRNVGDRKQLFIDRRFIESSDNVELHINPAQKVMIDIEFPGAHYPRNIIYIESTKVWRMYFSPFSRLQHAESVDGIHWKKFIATGQIGYESEEEPGKLLPLGFGCVVMIDPHDVPERRFKAFQEINYAALDADGYEIGSKDAGKDKRSLTGVYAFYSADGLRFKKAGRVLPILPEFQSPAPQWDPNINKYVVFFRVQNSKNKSLASIQGNQFFYRKGFTYENPDNLVGTVAPETMFAPGYENMRAVARIETDNLLKPWPVSESAQQETIYTTPNQVRMVFHADPEDGFADFYTHSTMVYPYAEDVYLMFPTFFRHFHPSRQPWFHRFDDANGPLETTLAVSRDGTTWDRVDRSAYIPTGRNDQWDRLRTMTGLGMVRVGNDLFQYYWGTGDMHDSLNPREDMPKDPKWNYGLGAVRQRLDGFVSADVDYRGGSITTPPITFRGSRLKLNHSSGAQGTIFVELRDLNDQPIPGYTLGDCEEVSGNDVAWEVRWQGSGDVAALAGRPIKIYFKMKSTKLYAFHFVLD